MATVYQDGDDLVVRLGGLDLFTIREFFNGTVDKSILAEVSLHRTKENNIDILIKKKEAKEQEQKDGIQSGEK